VKNDKQTFVAIGLSLQLQKLTFSSKQKFTQNPDDPEWYRPPIFFWTEGLNLMKWMIGAVLERISTLDAKVQDDFWQGSIPAQLFEDFPCLAKFKPAQVVEYCRIKQSSGEAFNRLLIRASGDRLCPKGAYTGAGIGETKMDEEKFVLNEAAKFKSVKHYQLSQFIFEAAKQNNLRFFIRLGKALQSREQVPDVDWKRCDPVACFLVENWCEWHAYERWFPPLCFFSDHALADFCSAMFGRNSGIPSVDTIRQWRRRLGLKQASRPKVRQISLKGTEVLFVGS
jgi:hypothetical protein